jgi:hypothetical protein
MAITNRIRFMRRAHELSAKAQGVFRSAFISQQGKDGGREMMKYTADRPYAAPEKAAQLAPLTKAPAEAGAVLPCCNASEGQTEISCALTSLRQTRLTPLRSGW